jgi:excisionase family DNA binding protein
MKAATASAFLAELVAEADEAILRALADRLAPFLPRPSSEDRWLTVESAARYLDCTPRRLYEFTSPSHEAKIPFERDGRRILFRRSELDAWVRGGGAKRLRPGPLTRNNGGGTVGPEPKSGAGVREHPAPGDGSRKPSPAAGEGYPAAVPRNEEG